MKLGRRGRAPDGAPLSKRALLQHVNRELWAFAADEDELVLFCECGRDDCGDSISLTHDEFAATRAHAACALVTPRHKGIFEPVLERHASFLVVADLDARETTRRAAPPEPPGDDPPPA
jgi:hypothetical protein